MRNTFTKSIIGLLGGFLIFAFIFPVGIGAENKPDKLDVGLTALEIFKAAGKKDSPDYTKIMVEILPLMVKSAKACPKGGTIKQLWYNIRFNGIVDRADMDTSAYIKELNAFLVRNGPKVLNGGTINYPNWGGMSNYWGWIILRASDTTMSNGWVLYIQKFKDEYVPWRFYYVNRHGTRNIWEYDGKRFNLKYTRALVNFKVDGTDMAAYYLKTIEPAGPRVVAVARKGEIYVVTTDAGGHNGIAAERFQPEGEFPTGVTVTSPLSSLSLNKKEVVAMNAGDKVSHFPSVTDADRTKIIGLLKEKGMPDDSTDILGNRIIKNGDSIYVVGTTFFRGTAKDLRKGNYDVGTFNNYSNGNHLTLLAQFKKGKIQWLNTSDSAVYHDFRKDRFSVTYHSNDPKRTFVCTFHPDGKQAASKLILNDYGTDIDFGRQGYATEGGWSRFTGLHIWQKREDGTPINYKVSIIDDMIFQMNTYSSGYIVRSGCKGAKLTNTLNNKSEIFTKAGHRAERLYPFAIQTVHKYPDWRFRQEFAIPMVNDAKGYRMAANLTINYITAVFQSDFTGQLHTTVTRSSIFGTVVDSKRKVFSPPKIQK